MSALLKTAVIRNERISKHIVMLEFDRQNLPFQAGDCLAVPDLPTLVDDPEWRLRPPGGPAAAEDDDELDLEIVDDTCVFLHTVHYVSQHNTNCSSLAFEWK